MNPHPESENVARTFKEFAYIVSHDLGTPLRAMVEFSRLLKEGDAGTLDKNGQLYLSMIIESGRKTQEMLAGLLEYSRLNTVTMPFIPTDCGQLVRQCREELAPKLVGGASLSFDELPVLPADTNQLKRLFMALLDNALTYHPPGAAARASVSAKEQGDGWLFAVRDNGIGIDPKFHERIFQPFKRLHTDEEYPGVGMGLALAKKIVERHRGRIRVESAAGKGATFLFLLPGEASHG